MAAISYTRPFLYPKQERAFFTPKRYSFIEASTKAGKTVGAIAWIIEQALQGGPGYNYWWVAPISEQARIAFSRIKMGLTVGTFIPRETPAMKVDLINNTTIWFKSADNPDSLYGDDVWAAVMDEASRAKEESWNAVRSTLTATQGKLRAIGNVKGRRNWFYRLSRLAESGARPNMHYERITVLDAIEAGVIPRDEVEDARATLPENVFRELYMAEPSDDGGNPFGLDHIAGCIRDGLSSKPAVAFGVDLGKKQDWCVVIGLDEDGAVCVFDRWQGIPWPQSIERIWTLIGDDTAALVDSTGLGDPVMDSLQLGHGNFEGYQFTSASKQKLMEGLAVAIQSREISYPDGIIRKELDNFEYRVTRTGYSYSAMEGLHDDCVAALALARQKFSRGAPAANLMEFYSLQAKEAKRRQEAQERDDLVLDIPDLYTPTPAGSQFPAGRSSTPIITPTENELTKIYNATVAAYRPEAPHCPACGQPLGANRISDGVLSWHPSCFGVRHAA